MKPSLPSYVCFMNIFNKYIEHTKSDYDSILHKIDTIVERIHKHFKYSDEQNLILEKNREKSKAIAGDHAAMTVKQIQTKKELKEIESNLADGMNEYGDEQAALLRLNMAIVEERACQWSLFQVCLFCSHKVLQYTGCFVSNFAISNSCSSKAKKCKQIFEKWKKNPTAWVWNAPV